MSPIPKTPSLPGKSDGWLMIGMIVRVIRFQSSLIGMGITGWTLRIQTVSSLVPVLKLKLFWNGTLIRLATGFCVSLARSVTLFSAGLSPPSSARAAPTSSRLAAMAATVWSWLLRSQYRRIDVPSRALRGGTRPLIRSIPVGLFPQSDSLGASLHNCTITATSRSRSTTPATLSFTRRARL